MEKMGNEEGIALLSLYNYKEDEEEEEEEEEAEQAPYGQECEILNARNTTFSQGFQQSNNSGILEQTSPLEVNRLTPSWVTLSQSQVPPPGINDNSSTILNTIDMEIDAAKIANLEAPTEPDPLADFLPPLPTQKCSYELQNKFIKYLALKNAGRSFNEELRKSKGYRNPDFLQRAVKYQEMDEIGSCFKKEVFDPHGYDPSDFYDVIASELKREMKCREQEKKQSQRVDFVSGGVYSSALPSSGVLLDNRLKTPLLNIGAQKGTATQTGLGPSIVNKGAAGIPASTDAIRKVEGRTNTKRKWDKTTEEKGGEGKCF